jgi:hypothetical protein
MEQDWFRESSRTLRERLDRRLAKADALRRHRHNSRPRKRACDLRQDSKVGVQPHSFDSTHPERQ